MLTVAGGILLAVAVLLAGLWAVLRIAEWDWVGKLVLGCFLAGAGLFLFSLIQ